MNSSDSAALERAARGQGEICLRLSARDIRPHAELPAREWFHFHGPIGWHEVDRVEFVDAEGEVVLLHGELPCPLTIDSLGQVVEGEVEAYVVPRLRRLRILVELHGRPPTRRGKLRRRRR